MADLEHIDWNLFRSYLGDEGIEIEQLIALLPRGEIAELVQDELRRIEDEEKAADKEVKRAEEVLDSYRYEENYVDEGVGFYRDHAIDDVSTYQVWPAHERLEKVQRSRKRLEELSRIDVLYRNPAFGSICGAVVSDFQDISDELIEYFAAHPDELHRLQWRKFEYLLDAIFRNQGYQTELGPGSGDAGVDIRLVQKDSIGELVTLVQAKRYSPQNPIHLEAVAALYGVVEDQQASRGLFVTTSRYLPSAMQFGQKHSQRLVLAASEDVARWCRSIRPSVKK